MKKHFYNYFIVLFLFLIPSIATAQKKVDFEKLDSQILKAIEDLKSTGAAVGIIKDGEVVFSKGYVFKNYNTNFKENYQ